MLTDTACRKAVPPLDKERSLADSGGLSLVVSRAGTKTWRWKYRFHGREKQLTIGRYPAISLAEARKARDRARELLAQGLDPSAEKRRAKTETALASLDTFERVARAWHADWRETRAERYAQQVLDRLAADVFPRIGRLPVATITAAQVLEIVRAIEARGAREMAHRVRLHISDVFVWAIASGLAAQDPAATIRKALRPRDPQLRPALLQPAELRLLLATIEALPRVWWATRLANRLLALTVARPGVVRLAERSEFEDLDGEAPLWRIPAAKMKLTRERRRDAAFDFTIPLSRQAAAVVRVALAASPSPRLLFPGANGWRRPISDSTLSQLYLDAGYRGRHVPHGWRAAFSTLMNERAARQDRERDRAIIDLMLAHVKGDVEAAYNRAAYLPRRRELAQAWADLLLEGLPGPETLIPAPR